MNKFFWAYRGLTKRKHTSHLQGQAQAKARLKVKIEIRESLENKILEVKPALI